MLGLFRKRFPLTDSSVRFEWACSVRRLTGAPESKGGWRGGTKDVLASLMHRFCDFTSGGQRIFHIMRSHDLKAEACGPYRNQRILNNHRSDTALLEEAMTNSSDFLLT